MSEYQYYEFVAVDRPLTEREMKEVRATSTRARITKTSFVNEYQWGDFKGSPDKMVEKYFDAHLYTSNFRSQRFLFRLPVRAVPIKEISRYSGGNVLEIRKKADVVLFDFNADLDAIDEEGSEEGAGWMSSLLPIREEVASGDFRSLYLGWLSGVHHGLRDEEIPEPPCPAGLGSLTAAQAALVEFLCLDPDLLEVAASQSTSRSRPGLDRKTVSRWVDSLSAKRKNAILLEYLLGESPQQRSSLMAEITQSSGADPRIDVTQRTVEKLVEAAEVIREKRLELERKKSEGARKQRAAKEAADRARYLETLSKAVEFTWARIEKMILSKKPTEYDLAVQLLVDLRDLAHRDKTLNFYVSRLTALCERHRKKESVLRRIHSAGLMADT